MASICQQSPQGFDQLSASAASARDAHDLPTAIALYRQALQLNPTWAEGWWYLGSLSYGSNAYADGRDALTHFIELTPQAGPARAMRGLCEFETGEYDRSLKDIQDGLALGAANASGNERLLRSYEAMLLTRAGLFEEALLVATPLAKSGPPEPQLLAVIGLAGLRTASLPREVPEDRHAVYLTAGTAAFQFLAGDEKGADAAFEELFRTFPTEANAHYLYGYLLQQSDSDRAAAQFQRELDIVPENPLAAEMLAWSLLMQDNAAKALPYAQRAGTEQPASPVAQIVLGRSLAETGNIPDGIQHLQKALELSPDNVEIHIALAEAYSRSGQPEDAWRERMACIQPSGSNGN